MTTARTIRPNILVLEGLFSDTDQIVRDAGGEATEVSPWDFAQVQAELESGEYTGMVLTGGSDIDPALYHEKPHPQVYGVDDLRDVTEMFALQFAYDHGLAVLGICRGSQIMCAARGGKLTQHIDNHRGGQHLVHAMRNARTFKRAINSRDMSVISLHHQCVRDPGKGMQIAARAMDGTPEAIESTDGRWLGVQFHPEMAAYENGSAFAIFQWLVKTSAEVAGGMAKAVRFRDAKRARRKRRWTGYGRSTTTNYHVPDDVEKLPTRKPGRNREAGTRTFVSDGGGGLVEVDTIRGTVVESGHELAEKIADAYLCPHCAMLFDYQFDRDDHVIHIHQDEDWLKHTNTADAKRDSARAVRNTVQSSRDMRSCLDRCDPQTCRGNCPNAMFAQGLTSTVLTEDELAEYPELTPPAGHPAWDDDDPGYVDGEVEETPFEACDTITDAGQAIIEHILDRES